MILKKGKLFSLAEEMKCRMTKKGTVKEYIRTHYAAFCEETPFQGFLILLRSHFTYERVMWLTIMSVALAYTARDCYKTVSDYMSEETVSKIVVLHNKTVVIATPTICMDIWSTQMDPTGSVDVTNGSEVELMFKEKKEEIFKIFTQQPDIIKQSKKNSRDQKKLFMNSTEQPLLKPLLFLVTNMISAVVGVENNHFKPKVNLTFDWAYRFETTSDRDQIRPSLVATYNFFNQHNFSFTELLATTGMYLCLQMELAILQSEPKQKTLHIEDKTDLCQRKFVTWLGPSSLVYHQKLEDFEHLCIRPSLPSPLFNFTSPQHTILISALPQALYSADFSTKGLHVYYDFKRDPLYLQPDDSFDLGIAEQREVTVDLVNHIVELNTLSQQCSEDTLTSECRMKCRGNYLQQQCHCYPLSLQFLFNSQDNNTLFCPQAPTTPTTDELIPYVNSPDCYQAILKEFNENENCMNECTNLCSYMTLKFQKPIMAKRNDHSEYTEAFISALRFTYPKIQQTLEMDKQQFISNLGGNLGLYLGATFVALAHVGCYVIRLLFYILRYNWRKWRQRKNSTSIQATPTCNNEVKESSLIINMSAIESNITNLQQEPTNVQFKPIERE